jgi:hypothetical protein
MLQSLLQHCNALCRQQGLPGLDPPLPQDTPAPLQHLIQQCLRLDPTQRPPAASIVQELVTLRSVLVHKLGRPVMAMPSMVSRAPTTSMASRATTANAGVASASGQTWQTQSQPLAEDWGMDSSE